MFILELSNIYYRSKRSEQRTVTYFIELDVGLEIDEWSLWIISWRRSFCDNSVEKRIVDIMEVTKSTEVTSCFDNLIVDESEVDIPSVIRTGSAKFIQAEHIHVPSKTITAVIIPTNIQCIENTLNDIYLEL